MLRFLLNDRLIETAEPTGTVVLDFIRQHKRLTGTKTGCREGDCGACTVLVGEFRDGRLAYRSMTSCLMPLGNAHGKHLVTVEGLNFPTGLNPVQQALVDESGTQCGFCTVGFVVSLAGFCLDAEPATYERGIAAIDGNICRCTGYKSIERAVARIVAALAGRSRTDDRLGWLVQNRFLPPYFSQIPQRLLALRAQANGHGGALADGPTVLGGGTDLFVQRPEAMRHAALRLVFDESPLKTIRREGDVVRVGAACTADDLGRSPVMQRLFPNLAEHLKLVSSTPIRNMGTVGGNLVNASPIGDLTIWFLALGASVTLRRGTQTRTLPLKDFYLGYKTLDQAADEILETICFPAPTERQIFSFEKVCKRTHLDIASVNTALLLETDGGTIVQARLSAGGVAPIPLFLEKTSEFLAGKTLSTETLEAAAEFTQTEISPISDVRGSADYKRLLLRQLLFAHFLKSNVGV
jgi:xanthine dehydrogenase small subunit